jgi:hypothetical protein
MLPGFTSLGTGMSWAPLCAEPTDDNKIMREKDKTRIFIMITQGNAQ